MDRVQGYDKDQIALIVLDFSNFGSKSTHHLGDTHHWMSSICNERGRDGCPGYAMGKCKAAHLLAVRRMVPIKVESDCDGGCITRQDGFMMCTQNVETLEPFSSHMIPVKMMETHVDKCINVMVQALHDQDGTLPPA